MEIFATEAVPFYTIIFMGNAKLLSNGRKCRSRQFTSRIVPKRERYQKEMSWRSVTQRIWFGSPELHLVQVAIERMTKYCTSREYVAN